MVTYIHVRALFSSAFNLQERIDKSDYLAYSALLSSIQLRQSFHTTKEIE